ncbi:MAG: hypothetical protein NZ927_09630 [Candidatus Calescibacterium sp.]|nr:hypothetical protein [Candidatus Calescibacterium sp.]MDW8088069.1 hypothetical protein [Candidatus Calescibacterium sp.]
MSSKIFISVIDPSAKIYISKISPYLNAEIYSTSSEIGNNVVDLDNMSVVGFPSIKDFFFKILDLMKFLGSVKIDIGVFCDSPDFNILAGTFFRRLQKKSKSIYFIPPTVWAWRPERKNLIEKNFDLVIYILPFEKDIWKEKGVYVGHPICKIIKYEMKEWKSKYSRNKSANKENEKICAFLPGSRISELKNHREIIENIWKFLEGTKILVPTEYFWLFQNPYKVVPKEFSRWTMYISDFVITASGTASLESALLGKPSVVFYKLPKITYNIAKKLIKVQFVSLPNIILGKEIFPELLQDEADARKIYDKLKDIESRNFSEYSEKLLEVLDGFEFSEIARIIQS